MKVKTLEKGSLVTVNKIDDTLSDHKNMKYLYKKYIGGIFKVVDAGADSIQKCILEGPNNEKLVFHYSDLSHYSPKKPKGGKFEIQNLVVY